MIVATHDPEFAAACATRAVLLADGRVIADGSTAELLAGGWYFATETARILGGAGGALLPEQGAELLASAASSNYSTAVSAISHATVATPQATAGSAPDTPRTGAGAAVPIPSAADRAKIASGTAR